MSKIALIAAVAEKGAIGRDQQLLCHLPNDLKHFKTLTSGHTVVMGRKTFESLPNGALPNRKNIVLTHNTSLSWPNVTVVHTLDEIPIQDTTEDEIFIMGGSDTIQRNHQDSRHAVYHTHSPYIRRRRHILPDHKPIGVGNRKFARNAGRRETRLSLYVCNLYQKTDRKPGTFRQITGSIPIDLRHIPVIVEFQFYERSRVQLHFISPIVTSRFDNSGSRILCSDISQQITRQNIYL